MRRGNLWKTRFVDSGVVVADDRESKVHNNLCTLIRESPFWVVENGEKCGFEDTDPLRNRKSDDRLEF